MKILLRQYLEPIFMSLIYAIVYVKRNEISFLTTFHDKETSYYSIHLKEMNRWGELKND